MWLAALSALHVAVSIGPAQAHPVKAKVTGQPIEVSIEIPGFAPEKEIPNPGRCLLYGRMKDDVLISVLWEENFPYVGAAECPAVYSKEQGFHSFTVSGKTCCQFRTEYNGAISQSQSYAFLTTPDFLFTIHASKTSPLKGSGGPKELKRSDMESIAARPEYKKRAAEEMWLASLRPKPEFKKLVGN
jgi:hypothetical protein